MDRVIHTERVASDDKVATTVVQEDGTRKGAVLDLRNPDVIANLVT